MRSHATFTRGTIIIPPSFLIEFGPVAFTAFEHPSELRGLRGDLNQ